MSTNTPSKFRYHTAQSAPKEAKPSIQKSIDCFGFLPNLHAIMAEAPSMLASYHALWDLFGESSLSPLEQQVVLMAANFENDCHYCVPGHSYIMTASGMPADVIESLRNGTPITDSKLESLRTFSIALIQKRGHVGDNAVRAFIAAGYSERQALEVIVGLAMKLLSNYTNAIAHTELDEPVKNFAWTKPVDD